MLERLGAGDRLALARVTRMITARLRSLGAYDLRDEWDDVCQEVVWALVRAHRAGRAPAPEKVAAYVYRITWNQFVNCLRTRGRTPQGATEALDSDAVVDSVADSGADSLDRFAARQALARLGQAQQSLLVAHYLEGETVATLVASTGRSRATLNRQLRDARDAFRAALGDGWAGLDPKGAGTAAGSAAARVVAGSGAGPGGATAHSGSRVAAMQAEKDDVVAFLRALDCECNLKPPRKR